jgi:hypothetical protein
VLFSKAKSLLRNGKSMPFGKRAKGTKAPSHMLKMDFAREPRGFERGLNIDCETKPVLFPCGNFSAESANKIRGLSSFFIFIFYLFYLIFSSYLKL